MNHRPRLEQIIRSDPGLMGLLEHLRAAALPEWLLAAGCLYQTVWNVLTRRPYGTGIQDHDVIYYDSTDLSWEAEDKVIRQVASGAPRVLQIRNQARVHLWFEQRFGLPFAPLRSADESLTRYPATVQAVGARLEHDGRLDIVAPFGLDDLFGMVMRPNRALDNRSTYTAKAGRAREVWPEITVLDWDAA